MELVELPYLAIGAPAQIAVTGVSQVEMRDLLETARRIKARGKLVGDRLVVNKVVCAGRADGQFVELLGTDHAPFEAGDLGARQGRTVFEILGANLRPYLKLFVVRGQGVEMLLSLVKRCGIAVRRVGKRTIEVKLCRFKK